MFPTKDFSPWRPDKVVIPKENMKWRPKSIHVVGKFAMPRFQEDNCSIIREDNIVRTPSDHMGLFTIFEFKE